MATFFIYSNASRSMSNLSDINLNTPTLFWLSFVSFKIQSFWNICFGYVPHQQQIARSNNPSSSFVNGNTEFIYIYLDNFLNNLFCNYYLSCLICISFSPLLTSLVLIFSSHSFFFLSMLLT